MSKIKKLSPEHLNRIYLFLMWLIIRKKKTHGYALLQTLKESGFKSARASMLYPLLNQMLKQGLLSQKTETRGKRVRKLYSPAPKGRKLLLDGRRMFSGLFGEFVREMVK